MASVTERGKLKKARKKKKRLKRELVGYDGSKPNMCKNCVYYIESLYNKPTREFFPQRCHKHEFEVVAHATCAHFESDLPYITQ